MTDYIDSTLNRFLTPGITDTISRISRAPIRKLSAKDRLTGPAVQCEEKGLSNEMLLQGIAAAFLFDVKEDPQSIELLDDVKEHGIDKAITKYTEIQPETRMFEKIKEYYNTFKSKGGAK